MASLSSSLATKMVPKLVIFNFQGVSKKLCFQDDYLEIWDTELGHIDWNTFLVLCNKPTKRSPLIFTLIGSRLVNVASHSVSTKSLELIMKLA